MRTPTTNLNLKTLTLGGERTAASKLFTMPQGPKIERLSALHASMALLGDDSLSAPYLYEGGSESVAEAAITGLKQVFGSPNPNPNPNPNPYS